MITKAHKGSLQLDNILKGDCVEILSKVKKPFVDLVFADPPFNIGYQYDVYNDKQDRQKYLDWTQRWMAAACQVLKPNGTFWVAIGDEYAAEFKLIAQNDLGLICRSWVIWYYTFGVNCKKKFSRSHAHLFHFIKDPTSFTFNDHTIRVPSARQLVYGDRRANPQGRLPDDTWVLRPQDLPHGFAPDHDTWYFPRVAGTFKERAGFHGCQMPEQLLGRIIRACSDPGGVVLDPFAGSGTTLSVAKKLDRHWLGVELSSRYVKLISQRVNKASVGQTLEGAAEPLVSSPGTPLVTPSGRRSNNHRRRIVSVDRMDKSSFSRLQAPKSDRKGKAYSQEERAIIDALINSHAGMATDHVLANPDLNESFLDACQRKGASGTQTDWNRMLIRLRKATRLPRLEISRTRVFTRKDMDQYSFASEIAWYLLATDYGLTLDDILCDPKRSEEFDTIAAQWAPNFSSYEYRWAALAHRKLAGRIKTHVAKNPERYSINRLPRSRPIDALRLSDRPMTGGVYFLWTHPRKLLYVGETLNLRRRLEAQFGNGSVNKGLKQLKNRFCCESFRIGELRLDNSYRDGCRSHLIGRHGPALNSRAEKVA